MKRAKRIQDKRRMKAKAKRLYPHDATARVADNPTICSRWCAATLAGTLINVQCKSDVTWLMWRQIKSKIVGFKIKKIYLFNL